MEMARQVYIPKTLTLHARADDSCFQADYIVIDPTQGAAHLWLNVGYGVGAAGAAGTTSAPGPLRVTNGISGLGAAVRLADLDGDGRDDYISVGPIGQAIGALNGGISGTDSWNWIPVSTRVGSPPRCLLTCSRSTTTT